MSTDPTAESKPRFLIPNTFQVPNILCDELLAELSGSELKVLLYIIRRTFGFQREADNISLSQMLNGIRRRDGTAVDRGVGLTKKPLLAALRSLKERALIHTEQRRSRDRGDEPTTYRLTLSDWGYQEVSPADQDRGGESPPPVGEKLHHPPGGASPPPPWGRNSTTQNQVRNPVLQNPDYSNSFESQRQKLENRKLPFRDKRNFENLKIEDEKTAKQSLPDARETTSGLVAVGEVVRTRPIRTPQKPSARSGAAAPTQTPSIADPPRDQPAARSRTGGRRSLADQAPPAIAALIEQFSGEFHDEDHVPSNVSQAVHLWQASGQEETTFATAMYEARARTQRAADIQKRADGEAGEWGMRNKMPYYFACLRDVLGMKPAPDSS